jgi:ATP-dependent RNA circularization protein (DNA/RNA ligase family)
VSDDFFRFPHTPHLAWLGSGQPRDGKVLSRAEAEALLNHEVVVEEKLDGANVGISLAPDGGLRVQNRGQYLLPPYRGQFARLSAWLEAHADALFDALAPGRILFGELCAARHSLDYNRLPDWWLLFDVYERQQDRFWSTERRNDLAAAHGLITVPTLVRGHLTLAELVALVRDQRSRFRQGAMEGVVVRTEADGWTLARAKLVRPDFVQNINTHWRRRALQWNQRAAQI